MSWFRKGDGAGKAGAAKGGKSGRTTSLDKKELRAALRRGKKAETQKDRGPSTEDLIISGKLDEAEQRLHEKLKGAAGDHHARLKLAEVLERKKEADEALIEYLAAADTLTREGFLDHAEAVLRRAERLAPASDEVGKRQYQLNERKQLEQIRRQAVSAMSEASKTATGR